MFHLRRMPPKPGATPGGLGDDTYANILAYLLQANRLEPSASALPSNTGALAALTIPRLEKTDSIRMPRSSGRRASRRV